MNKNNSENKREPKTCNYCGKEISYSNFAVHIKKCKVKQQQDNSLMNDMVNALQNENRDLKIKLDLMHHKYNEVLNINNKLISKFPQMTEKITLD